MSTTKYRLIYSIKKHEHLGFMIEPLIVELMKGNKLSLKNTKIYKATLNDYIEYIDCEELDLINESLEIEESSIISKFYKKPINVKDFFDKHYSEINKKLISAFILEKLNKIFDLLYTRDLFFDSGKNVTYQQIDKSSNPLSVVFNFNREDGILKYFPEIYDNETLIDLSFLKEAIVITEKPLRILSQNKLYCFDKHVEGNKIFPFFSKDYIEIPLSKEKEYLEKFVTKLVTQYDVRSNDIEIREIKVKPIAVIYIENIFGNSNIALKFKYDIVEFEFSSTQNVITKLINEKGKFVFIKYFRNKNEEQPYVNELISMGLKVNVNNLFDIGNEDYINDYDSKYKIHDWVSSNLSNLKDLEIEIVNNSNDIVHHDSSLQVKLKERKDWFEVEILIQINEQIIPFIDFIDNIRSNNREFKLKKGGIFIIPSEWFSKLKDIADNIDPKKEIVKVKKSNFKQIDQLKDFVEDKEIRGYNKIVEEFLNKETVKTELPECFAGELRSYQLEGFYWLCKLDKFNFGACLADDMGLGKTIQILAFLSKLKEIKQPITNLTIFNEPVTNLVVMPSSLIHNWCAEAIKFTPNLTYYVHYGNNRSRNTNIFSNYDIVFTTYGIVRSDVDILSKYTFRYIILDESQAIKNPLSLIYKSLINLDAQNRIVINGTPIENSLSDLWAQLSFVNPELLGSFGNFKKEYIQSIEKNNDLEKIKNLQSIVSPFILRRTKKEVEKDLPEKTEMIFYSDMTLEQTSIYEKIKSAFRNEIINNISKEGLAKASMSILTGLLRLRQIANHPNIYDKEYSFESGKFNDVIRLLTELIPNHKVLIFSQFVNHLRIYREYFDNMNIKYSYLDGSTQNREHVINDFKEGDNKIFLLSLKAGGYGLNLTEADYVFLLDPWWNPQVENQAMDRAHRIGQDKKVFVYKFITKNTVEEKIQKLQENKQKLSDSIIEEKNKQLSSLTESDIKFIFE